MSPLSLILGFCGEFIGCVLFGGFFLDVFILYLLLFFLFLFLASAVIFYVMHLFERRFCVVYFGLFFSVTICGRIRILYFARTNTS